MSTADPFIIFVWFIVIMAILWIIREKQNEK